MTREAKPASLTVEFRAIGELVPYANNARTHTPAQVAQIKALMIEYGWTNPVLADATGIIAGHGRVLAAQALYADGKGLRLPGGRDLPLGTVPVLDCTGWSDAQRRAYIIADNKSALNAEWDAYFLQAELKDLEALGVDLALTGFEPGEIEVLFATGSPPDAFQEFDEQITTHYRCPKCHFEWSGKPHE